MILDRIKQFIDHKGIAVSAFERSIGMSNASFGKSLKNGGAIGTDKLENFLNVYPEVSPTWLLTGEGEMLKQNDIEPENAGPIIKQLLDKITEQAEEIGQLKERIAQLEREKAASSSSAHDADYEPSAHAG